MPFEQEDESLEKDIRALFQRDAKHREEQMNAQIDARIMNIPNLSSEKTARWSAVWVWLVSAAVLLAVLSGKFGLWSRGIFAPENREVKKDSDHAAAKNHDETNKLETASGVTLIRVEGNAAIVACRVKQGDVIGDYKVVSVEEGKLTLKKGDKTFDAAAMDGRGGLNDIRREMDMCKIQYEDYHAMMRSMEEQKAQLTKNGGDTTDITKKIDEGAQKMNELKARLVDLEGAILAVKASEPKVTITGKKLDVRDVIVKIAEQAKANIIVPSELRGEIDLNLTEVLWTVALEQICGTVGFIVSEQDGVYTMRYKDVQPK